MIDDTIFKDVQNFMQIPIIKVIITPTDRMSALNLYLILQNKQTILPPKYEIRYCPITVIVNTNSSILIQSNNRFKLTVSPHGALKLKARCVQIILFRYIRGRF